jgi:hypothetical protein
MKKEMIKTFRAFAIELTIYALLVVAYFFLVLHLLGNWLHRLEGQHRVIYAFVAILLIIGQAVVLESVTTSLLRLLRGRSE